MVPEEKEELLEELENLKKEDWPIIVEGKKDKRCLEALGFSNIFTLNGPLFFIPPLLQTGALHVTIWLPGDPQFVNNMQKKDTATGGLPVLLSGAPCLRPMLNNI